MTSNDKDRGRSRRLGAEHHGWSCISRVLGDRMIGRSGDAVCNLYHTCGWDENRKFFGFGLKTDSNVLVIWVSKSPQQFLDFSLKIKRRRFVDLCIKTNEQIKTMWGHASTSGDLLHHEASRVRVFQFYLKTDGRETTDDVCGIIAEVVYKWSKRRSVRWRQMRRDENQTKLPFINYNSLFSLHEHFNLFVELINSIKGVGRLLATSYFSVFNLKLMS
jgi:hypothetical protein